MLMLASSVCGLTLAASASTTNKLSVNDAKFVSFAAETDMTLAHEGQMAENQASSQNVKDFGRKLTQDFSNAYGRLLELAQHDGQTIPRGIDVRRDRDIASLEHLKGRAFDENFVRDQIREDQATIARLRNEAEHGRDAGLKAWAQESLATLEADLMQARQLAKAEKSRS
jgi:putative membrane protein